MKLRLPLALALLLLSSLSFSIKAEDYYWVSTAGSEIATGGGGTGWYVKDESGEWTTAVTVVKDWTAGTNNVIHIDKDLIERIPGSVVKDIMFDFYPLALGGLSVNMEGFSFTAGGTRERSLQFNAGNDKTSCDFVIDEDFSIKSQSADKNMYAALNADWNVNIAGGKTFTLDARLAMMRDVTGKKINITGEDAGNRAHFILARSAILENTDTDQLALSALSADWSITNAELTLNALATLGTGKISGNGAQLTFRVPDVLSNALEVGENGMTILSSGLTINGHISGAGELVISAPYGAPSSANVLLQSKDNTFTGKIRLENPINLIVHNESGQAFTESVDIDLGNMSQMFIGVAYAGGNHFEMGNLSGVGTISGE